MADKQLDSIQEILDHPELIDKALVKLSYYEFIKYFWHILEPATKFADGWHIEALADHAQAVVERQIGNLIVNIPPRHMKSVAFSQMLTPWAWTLFPGMRFLYSSYAANLSVRDSVKARRLIESAAYQALFFDAYRLTGDQNTKSMFENNRGGVRYSTSTGSALTGFGGSTIIVDDAQNSLEMRSKAYIETTLNWWDQAMSTRLDDKKTGRFIIVMQRLHDQDLTGHVLAKEIGWEHLCLPCEYDPKHKYLSKTGLNFVDRRTEPGELLWPAKEGPKEVADLKRRLGPMGTAGQLQQLPVPKEGGFIKEEWLQYYNPAALPVVQLWVWSWDTAYKKGRKTIILWARCGPSAAIGYYLVQCHRQRLLYPQLRQKVKHLYDATPSDAVLIEDKSSGQSLVQDFRDKTKMPIFAMMPGKKGHMPLSREERVNQMATLFMAGKVFLPEGQQWLNEYVTELVGFPFWSHDDQVDSTSQALCWFKNRERMEPEDAGETLGLATTQDSLWDDESAYGEFDD